MKLINRNELENRLEYLFEKLGIDADDAEEIYAQIEDLPYLDAVKLTNGNLKGTWCNLQNLVFIVQLTKKGIIRYGKIYQWIINMYN